MPVYIKDKRQVVCSVGKKKFRIPTKKFRMPNGRSDIIKGHTITEKTIQKYKYPMNYDIIVANGKIKYQEDDTKRGCIVTDDDGNPCYNLIYEGYKYPLVTELNLNGKVYLTLDYLTARRDCKIFKFRKISLEKYLPILEAERTQNSSYPLELTHSPFPELGPKGRNGKQLYFSSYMRSNLNFWVIRDASLSVEYDKTLLLSLPIVLAASSAQAFSNVLTYLPFKLGEYLISRRNNLSKLLGYPLFIPTMVVRNSVNFGATLLKMPLLLFVNEKNHGNQYGTLWKYQFKKYWHKMSSDYSLITKGKRPEPKADAHPEFAIVGTSAELNIWRSRFEELRQKFASDSSTNGS